MAGFLALNPNRQLARRIGLPILAGLFLSCAMEFIQRFEPVRDSSALDVVTNVAGTVLGVGLGLVFLQLAPDLGPRIVALRPIADRAALSLVFLWVGYLTFPWFPVFGSYLPLRRLHILTQSGT